MRSYLTRRVFQRLLLNEPLVQQCQHSARNIHHQCRRGANIRPSIKTGRQLLVAGHVPRRTFFGLFDEPERQSVALRLDPGIEKMLELDKRIHLNARLPPMDALLSALKKFFNAKQHKNRIIEDFHARILLQTWQTVRAQQEEMTEFVIRPALFSNLQILAESSDRFTETHAQLAETLYEGLLDERLKDDKTFTPRPPFYGLDYYIRILCRAGKTVRARDKLAAAYKGEVPDKDCASDGWSYVLESFMVENNKSEFEATLDIMRRHEVTNTRNIRAVLAIFYARQNDVINTKKWVASDLIPIKLPLSTENQTILENLYQEILEFCIRNGEVEWGQTVLSGFDIGLPNQRGQGVIFGAAAATGKSVEEIDDMISVIMRRTQEALPKNAKAPVPYIEIFNSLIRYAIRKNDSYMAERYFQLLNKWKSVPNHTTYILQMEYRLAVGDLDGALAAYNELKGFDVPDGADWPTVNKLLQALVSAPNSNQKRILELIQDVSSRKRLIMPDTIHALCKYHLRRDEYFEIVDLLHIFSFQFSITDRTKIRDVLSSYTLDPSTDTSRAWDAYMIFHQVFDLETRRDVYNQVMTSFFRRRREDLAMHVFMIMSRHRRADTRPDIDTYTRAFEGIGSTPNLEALTQVHNLFKLDTENEPCTRALNGLMIAYTACGEPLISLEIWEDISKSAEGPDLNSINIALRTCERAPYGYEVSRVIWAKLRGTNVMIDKMTLTNYLATLMGARFFDEAKAEIYKMKETTGEEPDAVMFATLYNSCPNRDDQEEFAESLIKKDYPHLWAEIEQFGFGKNQLGKPLVKGIDRTLKA